LGPFRPPPTDDHEEPFQRARRGDETPRSVLEFAADVERGSRAVVEHLEPRGRGRPCRPRVTTTTIRFQRATNDAGPDPASENDPPA
jgi:hypothetical protein